jgi:hypothetical protein
MCELRIIAGAHRVDCGRISDTRRVYRETEKERDGAY